VRRINRLLENDFIVSLITKLITIITGVVTTSLLNRYLGPTLKGEYAYFINIINILIIVLNLGISNSYGYSKRKNMQRQSERYINTFVLQFIFYSLFCFIVYFFIGNSSSFYIILLIPIQTLANQMTTVTLIDYIRFRQKTNIFIANLNMILTLFLYSFCVRKIEYAYGILVIKDLLSICIYLYKYKIRLKPFKKDYEFWKYAIKYGVYAMFSALLLSINYKIDVVFLRQMVNSTETGLYSVGIALAEYAWLIPDAFKDVIFAKTAKDDAIDTIKQSIRINIVLAFFYILGIVAFGKIIIFILYGNDYIASYWVTCILFLGIPSMILFKLTAPLYMANGRQKFYFIALLISAISNIIGNMLLIPLMGKEGAALSSVISYNICGLIFYIKFINDYKIRWFTPLIISKEDINSFTRRIIKNEK
jgi:O-antigen/teichoic acid export membrane protein